MLAITNGVSLLVRTYCRTLDSSRGSQTNPSIRITNLAPVSSYDSLFDDSTAVGSSAVGADSG